MRNIEGGCKTSRFPLTESGRITRAKRDAHLNSRDRTCPALVTQLNYLRAPVPDYHFFNPAEKVISPWGRMFLNGEISMLMRVRWEIGAKGETGKCARGRHLMTRRALPRDMIMPHP